MSGNECPLGSVHSRLNEVHKFWHDMLAEYQKPENFRIDLNAAIQALRNVTFILQSHKSLIPDFNDWYGSYQNRMREDKILAWLHQARNIIVKQKDLELHSIASARVWTWDDIGLLVMQISPFLSTEQLAKDLVRLHVVKAPQSVVNHAVLTVERSWMVNDLPKHELLSVIAHGYLFLENLVDEAHGRGNLPQCERRQPRHQNSSLPCMSITRNDRSVNMKLGNQRILPKVEFDDIEKREPVRWKKSVERYKNITPALPRKIDDLFAFARIINERARKMLVMDKYHQAMFLLCYPDGIWKAVGMNAENQSEKFILVRSLADQVRQTKANGVIAISEAWTLPEKELKNHELPAESPKRGEGLQILAVDKNRILALMTFFTRDKDGTPQLGGIHEQYPKSANIMRPIIEALRELS